MNAGRFRRYERDWSFRLRRAWYLVSLEQHRSVSGDAERTSVRRAAHVGDGPHHRHETLACFAR